MTSEYFIAGGEGGTAPVPTGGDETGTWVYTRIRVYLPAQARGLFDPATSTVEGTGFIAASGGRFRQFVDTTSKLATVAGPSVRENRAKLTGTYVKTMTALTLNTECRESIGDSTSPVGDIGFSRVDGTHALLHIVSDTQIGSTTLVVELELRP